MANTLHYFPTGYSLLHEDEHCTVYGSPDGLSAIAYHGNAKRYGWHHRSSTPVARDARIASSAAGWKRHEVEA